MKRTRYISLIIALLSILGIAAQQQQSQYALYNYRNDGDFNAWLNIDVDSITYSNIGIDSVEYDNLVTQEVWTPDSCYRIPLEVIDSIGFRAPETKYKEDTFFLNEEHEPYVRNIDDLKITFDSATPAHLLPSVGQVICTETSYGILEDGFAGRATSVSNTDDGIELTCEEVSLSDIFEQIIYVSKCSSTEGIDPETYHAGSSRRRIFDYGIGIDEVIPIEFDPVETPKKIDGEDMPCQFKYTPEFDITCNISVLKNHPAVAKIMFHHSHTMSLKMDYEGDIIKPKSKEWWFNKKDIRIHIPVAAVDAVIKPYVNFGAFVDYNAKVKFEYELPLFKFEQTFGVDYSEYRDEENRLQFINETETTHDDPTLSLSLDGSLAFGLAMKIGAKLIHKRLLNFEATFHVGPEFKGHIDLSTDRIGEDANLYRQLKTTTLDLYGYVSIPRATYQYVGSGVKLAKRGTWKGAKWSNRITKTEDLLPNEDNPEGIMTDWPIKKWHLLPEFEKPDVYEANATAAVASVEPSRNLLFPVDVGLAFKDYRTGEVIEQSCGEYWGEKHNAESNYIATFEDLTPSAIYKVYPTVKFAGILSSLNLKMDAEPSVDYNVAGKLIVTPSTITIKKGEEAEVIIFGAEGNLTTIDDDPSIAKSLSIIYDHRTGQHITLHIMGVNVGSTYITVLHRSNGSSCIVRVNVIDIPDELALSEQTVSLQKDESATVLVLAGCGNYTAESSNENVATATVEDDMITITAISVGSAVITVTDTETEETATIEVSVTESGGNDNGQELIVNGDFSSGNTGFTSDYIYASEPGDHAIWDEGTYAVGTSPRRYHSVLIDCGDHTTGTGNMLIANGSLDNTQYVWKQKVGVEAGKTYEFSAWFKAAISANTFRDDMEYSINGTVISGAYDKKENGWERYYGTYTATNSGQAEIRIRTMSETAETGNDFALDDISFKEWTSTSSPDDVYLKADEGTPGAISDESYATILDEKTSTKWCFTNSGGQGYVIFHATQPIKVTGYKISTGNDTATYPERNPKSWTLYGSTASSNPGKDGTSWEVIDTIVDDTKLQAENYKTYVYTLPSETVKAYRYFKWVITSPSGIVQVSEFRPTYSSAGGGAGGGGGSSW